MSINQTNYEQYFTANKEGWNKRTQVHKNSAFYDVPSFKAGKSALNAVELEELGNVKGKSLLHLQCHFGLDTLSWAREGAIVTGVDLSNDAIDYANELSSELNIPAEFICCNVYDLPVHLHEKFDIVFTSYGVLGWLPDLDNWASIIACFLKPGGVFSLVEFHPVIWMMDDNFKSIRYAYHNTETIAEKQRGTYADPTADIEYEEYSWNHSLSEVINSLIKHGLQIEHLNEFPYSFYSCFNNVVQGPDGYWRIKGSENKIPMMYSIKAVKAAHVAN
jgi:2-polyprenyl-3-methyl-5-hydroxy-6-metoxy-1,4-benzoquinol methylase